MPLRSTSALAAASKRTAHPVGELEFQHRDILAHRQFLALVIADPDLGHQVRRQRELS
jgi:hypothetical protein